MFNKEKDEQAKEIEREFDLFQEELLKNLDNSNGLFLMNNILISVKEEIKTNIFRYFHGLDHSASSSSLMYLLFNSLNETVQIKSNISDLKESNNDLNTKFDTLIKQNEELTTEFKELNNKFDKLIELLSKE